MQCCHYDDDPTNNHVSNLRWDTQSGNQQDRIRNGMSASGQRISCDTEQPATLSTMQVAEMLCRNEKWVRRHRELLGGHKDGDRWRYSRAAVIEYARSAADV